MKLESCRRLKNGRVIMLTEEEKKLYKTISERIRMARDLRGFNNVTLAEASGLPINSIQHYTLGRHMPRVESLVKLCDTLECSTDFILGRVSFRD